MSGAARRDRSGAREISSLNVVPPAAPMMRTVLISPSTRPGLMTDRDATSTTLHFSASYCADTTPPGPPVARFSFHPKALATQPLGTDDGMRLPGPCPG